MKSLDPPEHNKRFPMIKYTFQSVLLKKKKCDRNNYLLRQKILPPINKDRRWFSTSLLQNLYSLDRQQPIYGHYSMRIAAGILFNEKNTTESEE
jgi:hypothetical protein